MVVRGVVPGVVIVSEAWRAPSGYRSCGIHRLTRANVRGDGVCGRSSRSAHMVMTIPKGSAGVIGALVMVQSSKK